MSSYASLAELYLLGSPEESLDFAADAVKQANLDRASRIMDSYFGARYGVPLVVFSDDVKGCCAVIAAYLVFTWGQNPERNDDEFRRKYEDCIKWLEDVRDGKATPAGTVTDTTPSTVEGASDYWGEPDRGWALTNCDGTKSRVV